MKWIGSVLALLCVLPSSGLLGQTCSISSTPVSFGSFDTILNTAVDSTGNVTVTCDAQTPYVIRVDSGQYSEGGFQVRYMRLETGTVKLAYNLFRDGGRTQILGDGTGGSTILTGVATTSPQETPIYGRIFGGQNISAGLYRDTVTVTVEW